MKNVACGCGAADTTEPCCGTAPPEEAAGGAGEVMEAGSAMTSRDWMVHLLARMGVHRGDWRVEPGLYRLGRPDRSSPVFVTANYKLSFDALRTALAGLDAYLLILDTKGVNVWCAAGKGTFSTDELVSRIALTGLADEVDGRSLMVPQLGATGVAGHEVRKRSGFKVDFGPVRANDIPEYLRTGKATAEMRRVRFTLKDRLVLIPVETNTAMPAVAALSGVSFLAGDRVAAAGLGAAALVGLVGFPALLPRIPTDDFSTKGFVLGGTVGLGAALASLLDGDGGPLPMRLWRASTYLLALPPLTAFIALNFTGATPLTSPSQVRREISTYVPVMAGMGAAGIILNVAYRLVRRSKGR